jgi:hypothetical protein
MENQHQKITGYRELSYEEIGLMNEIKAKEAEVAALHSRVSALVGRTEGGRQASIARTEFEHAFMRLVRAVAQPATPWAG